MALALGICGSCCGDLGPANPCVQICVVSKVGTTPTPGAVVHVTSAGVDVPGSPCTTSGSGAQCCINVASTGTYGISVALVGHPTATTTLAATSACTQYTESVNTATSFFTLSSAAIASPCTCRSICVTVTGCTFPLGGKYGAATVTLLAGSKVLGTCDTVSSVVSSSFAGTEGAGYTSAPAITIADATGYGTGATATCTVAAGKINSVTITNGGSGYYEALATLTGGGGTGASIRFGLASKCCMSPEIANGTYTLRVSNADGHWNTSTSSLSISGANATATKQLTPTVGDCSCFTGTKGLGSADAVCVLKFVPTTLFLSDGFGVVTLTRDPGGGWSGCAIRTAQCYPLAAGANQCNTALPVAASSVAVRFHFDCTLDSFNNKVSWLVGVTTDKCIAGAAVAPKAILAGTLCSNPLSSFAVNTFTKFANAGYSCNPISAAFVLDSSITGNNYDLNSIYGNTMNITVSE